MFDHSPDEIAWFDCNDDNSDVYIEAPEIVDSIDNQCPGDEGYGEIDESP